MITHFHCSVVALGEDKVHAHLELGGSVIWQDIPKSDVAELAAGLRKLADALDPVETSIPDFMCGADSGTVQALVEAAQRFRDEYKKGHELQSTNASGHPLRRAEYELKTAARVIEGRARPFAPPPCERCQCASATDGKHCDACRRDDLANTVGHGAG